VKSWTEIGDLQARFPEPRRLHYSAGPERERRKWIMTEKKKLKRKKAEKRQRKERRFLPEQTKSTKLSVVIGMAGAAALGAGVYGQWIREPALGYAQYIVAGGALVLGVALWFGDPGGEPVRVGDVGVAAEKGSDLIRLAWCDMERIFVERGQLMIEGDDISLSIPLASHATAASWILKEAVSRVPEALDVKSRDSDALPDPKEGDGELVPVDDFQVAGRHCAASDKPISFERDARLCPTCAQVYHREHVPKKCVTCGETLAGRAESV